MKSYVADEDCDTDAPDEKNRNTDSDDNDFDDLNLKKIISEILKCRYDNDFNTAENSTKIPYRIQVFQEHRFLAIQLVPTNGPTKLMSWKRNLAM